MKFEVKYIFDGQWSVQRDGKEVWSLDLIDMLTHEDERACAESIERMLNLIVASHATIS